ncbi:hypothetical protein KIPB_016249, partial [Kipferlia bialata]|eukprot:g16249.t1
MSRSPNADGCQRERVRVQGDRTRCDTMPELT